MRIIVQRQFSRDENELIVSTDQLDIVTVYSDNSVKRNSSNERRYALKVIHTVIIVNMPVVCGFNNMEFDHVMNDTFTIPLGICEED